MPTEAPTSPTSEPIGVTPVTLVGGVDNKRFELVISTDVFRRDSGASVRQGLGLTDHLLLTLDLPPSINTLSDLAGRFPGILWLGFAAVRSSGDELIRFTISRKIWHPYYSSYSGLHYMRGYLYHHKSQKGGKLFTFMHFPSISRSGVLL